MLLPLLLKTQAEFPLLIDTDFGSFTFVLFVLL
jgi:hypothetical protein